MLSDVEKVLKLNRNALDEKAQLKSFAEQYGEYAIVRDALIEERASRNEMSAQINAVTPFVLCLNGSVFGIEPLNDMPLVITAASFKHIAKRHIDEFGNDRAAAYQRLTNFINSLSGEMLNNVLVFQSPDDGKESNYLFVLQSKSSNNHPITCIVQVNNCIHNISVEKVVSTHGNRHLWASISQSIDKEKEIYVNERTGAWLLSQCVMNRPHGHGLRVGSPATDREMENVGETTHSVGPLAALKHLSCLYSSAFPRANDVIELSEAISELEAMAHGDEAIGGIAVNVPEAERSQLLRTIK